MGIVYHANYVVWMEVGRVELCRSRGLSYRDLEAEGILMVVAGIECRYSAPAHYDDEISVETRIDKAHPRMVIFGYTIRRVEDGQLLATGESKHVFCSKAMQPVKLPSKYFSLFGMEPSVVRR